MKQFSQLHLAQGYIERCVKSMRIILGDNDKYWVVTPAEADRLYKQGYMYA